MKRIPLLAALVGLSVPMLAVLSPATADVVAAGPNPADLAGAIMETPDALHSAVYDGAVGAKGIGDGELAGFPTHGDTFVVLSTGTAASADDPDGEEDVSVDWGTTSPHPDPQGDPGSWGTADPAEVHDLAELRLQVSPPAGTDCLRFQARFVSEELDSPQPQFNDGFVVLMDNQVASNVAYDPLGNRLQAASMLAPGGDGVYTAANAAGTTYDGASPLITVEVPIQAFTQTVRFIVYDGGDGTVDSAVLLDNLSFGPDCHAALDVTVDPPDDLVAGGTGELSVSVTNPTSALLPLDEVVVELPEGLTYAGTTSGATTDDPALDGQSLTWTDLGDLAAGATATLGVGVLATGLVDDDVVVTASAGPNEGGGSGVVVADRGSTSTTARVAKTDRRVKVTGAVSPDQPGREVVVTLLRKRDGAFRKVGAKVVVLDDDSRYAAGFRRPAAGKCRAVARFAATPALRGSSSAVTFRC